MGYFVFVEEGFVVLFFPVPFVVFVLLFDFFYADFLILFGHEGVEGNEFSAKFGDFEDALPAGGGFVSI